MAGVSAILTAAGESKRMGRSKPLLAWRGVTLIEHQIGALTDGGAAEIVAVLGHKADAVAPKAAGMGARCVLNADYREGKTTSIKAGLSAVSADADAIMLLAVDQPRAAAIVSAVIAAHYAGGALITSPRYRGHGGHPLIFAASLRDELARISERKQGIREVFQRHRDSVYEHPIDDPMIRLDLNTPDAYEKALREYGTLAC